jgi:hypothetical protein
VWLVGVASVGWRRGQGLFHVVHSLWPSLRGRGIKALWTIAALGGAAKRKGDEGRRESTFSPGSGKGFHTIAADSGH